MAVETVLITGASSGIGLELAELFAADKSNLVLLARSEEKLREIADDLQKRHDVTARVLPADLADRESPQRIYDELDAAGVTIDVLVNNAGIGAVGKTAELPLLRQLEMIEVNVTALTHLTRLFLPHMLVRKQGGVLNVGSTAGFQPGPNMAVYYATKAFVVSFTEALAEELKGSGVTATCLAPGATETAFAHGSGMEDSLLFKLGTMNAKTVARAGHRAFRRQKVLVVPGWKNKLGVFALRLTPRFLVRRFVKRLQS